MVEVAVDVEIVGSEAGAGVEAGGVRAMMFIMRVEVAVRPMLFVAT